MSGSYYDHCLCLLFLDEWSDGRIEHYPACPRHWRLFEDEYSIPRESAPVDVEQLRDGRLALSPST